MRKAVTAGLFLFMFMKPSYGRDDDLKNERASVSAEVRSRVANDSERPTIEIKRRVEYDEHSVWLALSSLPTLSVDSSAAREETLAMTKVGENFHVSAKRAVHPIFDLVRERKDLQGLPLRKMSECRMENQRSIDLHSFSTKIREHLPGLDSEETRDEFFQWLATDQSLRSPAAIPALHQVLMAENESVREVVVDIYSSIEDSTATHALAKVAIFDFSPLVREKAIAALRQRPGSDYRSKLMDGLKYPFQPVQDFAAEAIVALDMQSVMPELMELAIKPNPMAAYESEHKKGNHFVNEVVSISHGSNCALCHGPAFGQVSDEYYPRMVVPIPESSFLTVTSRREYYGPIKVSFEKTKHRYVQADVTYLHQDFSACTPSHMQRFDFVARTRPASVRETALAKKAKPSESVLFAITELTKNQELAQQQVDP